MMVTVRLRSVMWFVTGAVLALLVAWVAMSAWRVEAAPGEVDTTTVPITACRLVDTRPDSQVGPRGTALAAEETYTVEVGNASTQCAGVVPAEASGLVLNVTAARTSARTFVTVWDAGPWPGTSSMNPVPGPPVPNAVTTKLSGSNTFEVYNNAGSTDLIIDVVAYLTSSSLSELDDRLAALESAGVSVEVLDRIEALEATNAALESDVAALQATTASMSTLTVDGQPTVRFAGVNVQIVDGTGDTDGDVNGRGNLIVGYNEDTTNGVERSGSHNLIVGTQNAYTSYGGAVFGSVNKITAPYATVTGGLLNTASNFNSSVSGGGNNTASNSFSSVSGGFDNTASGGYASVSGGSNNTASLLFASVSGGFGNTASGEAASVSGGIDNISSSSYASVSGGRSNTAEGLYSSVSGGRSNTANGSYASVSGGRSNTANGSYASVSGGESNQATGDYGFVAGGFDNTASGPRSVANGGGENTASGSKSVVSGGSQRASTGTFDWRAGTLFQTQ
jgi:hypothetical protein